MNGSAELSLTKPVGFQKYKRSLFLICFFSSMFGGTVSTLMSVYLPDAIRDLLQNSTTQSTDNISATINSIFIFGWTAGGIVWGIFCDTLGRKKSFIYATLCYGLFTILTGLSPTWFLVVLCRFLSGFGIGGVLVITTMLVSEGYQEKKREVLLGILIHLYSGRNIFCRPADLFCFTMAICIYCWRHPGDSFRNGHPVFYRI